LVAGLDEPENNQKVVLAGVVAIWGGNPYRERCPAFPAINLNCPTMHFDNVVYDRQAQPQSTLFSDRYVFRLAKRVEDMWKKGGGNALAGVADGDFYSGNGTEQSDVYPSAVGHEFY
jgi:hypothetical protein